MQLKEEQILDYLNGFSTDSDKQIVEKWVDESESNKFEFQKVKKLYDLSEFDTSDYNPNVDVAWNRISSKLFEDDASSENAETKVRKLDFSMYYKIAAALIMAVGLGYFMLSNNAVDMHTIATGEGQIEEILLADGSTIWVNENSTFSYPKSFADDSRQVNLEGEAFFDISRDESRPFTILSQETYTQVLGTSFNLKTKKGYASVNVVSGKVALVDISENSKVTMTKGQTGTYNNGTLTKIESADQNELAWRTGVLIFSSTNMNEVANMLEEYYNVDIELKGDTGNCLITAEFDNKSLDEVLEVLGIIANMSNERNNGVIYISGTGC